MATAGTLIFAAGCVAGGSLQPQVGAQGKRARVCRGLVLGLPPGVICFGTFPMDESHPRGTLAIVAVLGAFFALGWLAMFLFLFLERGAPQP